MFALYESFILPNYNTSTFAVFLSFSFLFHFYIHKIIHPWPSMRKNFLCTSTFLYMTNFFCTRIITLSLYVTWSIYKTLFTFKDFFVFSNTHLWFIQKFLYIHSLLTHTRISFHASLTHKKKSFYTHFPFKSIFLFSLYM